MTIDAEFLTGPLTTSSAFARYPSVVATDAHERKIPSITLVDVVCCNPQTQGCMALEARGETDGDWRTSPSHGCTAAATCSC